MTTIKTLSDLVSWLETWERDRAAGLVPASEVAHRALVIDLLKPFAVEEGAAVLAEREACAHVAIADGVAAAAVFDMRGACAGERIATAIRSRRG